MTNLSNNSKDNKKSLNLIGSLLLCIGFLCFVCFFVWVVVKGTSVDATRWQRLLPMILMLISLLPIIAGLALIIIASRGEKLQKIEGESRYERKQKKAAAKLYKKPKKDRDPRLGEIAYWRIEEEKPTKATNPFDIEEISPNQPVDKIEKD